MPLVCELLEHYFGSDIFPYFREIMRYACSIKIYCNCHFFLKLATKNMIIFSYSESFIRKIIFIFRCFQKPPKYMFRSRYCDAGKIIFCPYNKFNTFKKPFIRIRLCYPGTFPKNHKPVSCC